MNPAPLNIFVCHASGHPTDTLPHGDGLLALSFVKHLALRGHSVHVAVDQRTIRGPLPRGVHIYELNSSGSTRELSPLTYMHRSRRLFAELSRQVRFDLIHQLNPAFTGLSLAMVGTGIPCVIGPYAGNWLDQESTTLSQRLKDAIRMRIRYFQQRHASAILMWNNAARINVERTGALSKAGVRQKLFVVPPGIDTGLFSPQDGAGNSEPVILFLANIVRRKGIFTLLSAFETVAAVHSTCVLNIAGEGPELPELRRLAEASAFSDRIRFIGKVERSRIPEVMRACDIYCLPSYGEPFGMTALEAMACGKPVVVTDAGGLTELVPAQGGAKARPRDPESLAGALLTVLASPELRASMGAVNRQTAVEQYSWPRVIDRLEAVYSQVTQRCEKNQGAAEKAVLRDGSQNHLNTALHKT